MVHFAPDDKFFKGYDASKKELISLIASNNWTKAKSYATDFAKKVISSNRGELLQENSELLAQNIVDSAFNSVLGENKLQTWEIDELFETAKSTLSVTTFLETFNYLTRGGIKTRGLNSIEKMVVASQIPEIQKQLQEVQDGVWSSALKRDAKEALQYIDKIQQYTKQIPDDVQLKVSETADLVMSMDKIAEYEKKKNETTYPSIKENYEEKIQAENDKIKGILSNTKPKSNNTTDSTSVEQVNNLEGSENPNNTITDSNSGESPINNEQGVNSQAVEVQQIEQEKPIENNVSTPTSTEQDNTTEEEEQALPTILEESTPEDAENEGESIGDILNDPLFINSRTQGSISNKEETQQPTNETLPNEGQEGEINPQETQIPPISGINEEYTREEGNNNPTPTIPTNQVTPSNNSAAEEAKPSNNEQKIVYNNKEYYPRPDGGFNAFDKNGKLRKVTNKNTITKLEELANGENETKQKAEDWITYKNKRISIPSTSKVPETEESKGNVLHWRTLFNSVNDEVAKIQVLVDKLWRANKDIPDNDLTDMLDVAEQLSDNMPNEKARIFDTMSRATNNQAILDRAKKLDEELTARREQAYQERVSKADKQGNPIDENGKLITEKINSIQELTDADFINPSRSVELPTLSKKVDNAIGANGKPIVIKKNIFEKNAKNHKDLTPQDSRDILEKALYDTTLYGQNQKTSRPYNWIMIHLANKNSAVVLEVNENKDNVEIVNWHYLNERQFKQKERQAEREGGRILTLASAAGNTSDDLSYENKDTEKTPDKEVHNSNLGDISQSQAKSNSDKDIDFQKSEDYSSLSDRELKDEIQRISDEIKNDIAGTKGLLERSKARINHPLYSVYKELTDLKTERYQEKKKKQEEYEKNNPRVVYTPKREELKISAYSGERVVYHGTKENVANKIVREGIKFGSELSDTDWRGGGYGVTNQESFSTSLNPNISKYYSGEHKVGIVKLEINPNANVVTVENEIYAEDLQDYSKELEGVDAVYLKNSGEEELVILNKDAVKIVEAKSFKVSDNVVRFHKSKSTPYKKGKISQQAFDQLIAKLKKPFAKAFKNINILTDWEAFERKAEEYRKQKNGGTDFQKVNEAFNRDLENFENGKQKDNISLGIPSKILQATGLNDSEMFITPKTLRSHLDKHNLSVDDIKNLPQALQNPLMVYEWGTKAKSLIAITDIDVNGKKITIAVKLERNGKKIEVNELASIHGKENARFMSDMINANEGGVKEALRYVSNKEKVLEWLGLVPPKGTASLTKQELSIANVVKDFENPKIENESDAEYMCTPSGVIYGAKLPDGTIYINPEHLNANTPIHEFGHLWEQLMPQRFAKGVELLKNTKAGKELFQELRNNKGYKNYSDEKLWSEVLVTMLGNRGEELYHSNSTSRFVAWVKDFFKGLGNILHKLSNGLIGRGLTPEDKLSTFVKGALSDIMSGKEIIPESNIASKEVPIYLKDMDNSEIKQVLDRLGLIKPAQCA